MVVKEIHVRELFGAYDYDVDFESVDSNVSIIHAMNGRGKTTILNMIHSMFTVSVNVGYLDSVPFKSFTIGLSNGKEVKVEKENVFLQMLYKKNEYYRPFPITPSEEDLMRFQKWFDNMRFYVDGERVPMPVVGNPYMVSQMGDYLDEWQIFDLMEFNGNRVRWAENVSVWGIAANRLIRRVWTPENGYVDRPTIDECQDDLRRRISGDIGMYGILSEQIDSTFPLQVMRKLNSDDKEKDVLNKEEIEKKLSELNEIRERYKELGLIDETGQPPETNLSYWQEQIHEQTTPVEELTGLLPAEMSLETRIFLTTYINNVSTKLKTFDEIAECMEILKDYINSHSEYADKEMKYDAKKGMVFVSTLNGREIPTDKLSSGELNNLILFYDLLFNAGDGGIVLIDEPELSLHMLWQKQIIDELIKICDRGGIQAIVATHSPDVVGKHIDLTIGLDEDGDEDDDE